MNFYKVDDVVGLYNEKYFKNLPSPCKHPVYKSPDDEWIEGETPPKNCLLITIKDTKADYYFNDGWTNAKVPEGMIIDGKGGFKNVENVENENVENENVEN